MSGCCDRAGAEPDDRRCPACGERGGPVQLQTVKAMLTEAALRRIELTHYRFCRNGGCQVVYFGDSGDRFTTRDLRVAVWQKQPSGARLLCYCFGENEAAIRIELLERGGSNVVNRIRQHIAAHRCACDIRNPRGVCCLGDVMAAVTRMQAELPARKET